MRDILKVYELGGPPRGLGDSGRRAIYLQGFGEKGLFFRYLGRKYNFLGL